MLPNTDYEVRYLNPDDVEQYNALLRYSFQITEQDLSECGWRNDEIKQSKFPVLKRADVLGCFDAGALVSQIAVYPVKMNVYGSACPAGFVTSVCTYPEYTGNGIMKRLMRQSLEHMRRKELIYLSREAQEGLWEYIRAHDSMIDEVRGSSYFSDPIAFELEDGDIRETIRPYIMGRIVDVEQFFQRYHCDPAAEQQNAYRPVSPGRMRDCRSKGGRDPPPVHRYADHPAAGAQHRRQAVPHGPDHRG